jgi:hypothetical protein
LRRHVAIMRDQIVELRGQLIHRVMEPPLMSRPKRW